MVSPDQKEMLDVLERQRQHQLQVDRVLKIVLPIVAFLLSVIAANMNIWSALFTFVMLWIAFYAVGIKRYTLWHWLTIILVYCLIDNVLSYDEFYRPGFNRHFISLFIFVGIVGVGRRYFDRWWMEKNKSAQL
ncbi:hypothetical protein KMZ14_00995 [Acinetobacter schindleri]|jgi:hypothetical protein|uniref:hypothetical protein n=1 Tax=Acinetobacter schindleri TaxID=108981 RepID=UPI0023626628|nr:hypothetical protein [Acinetobacter schindleri]WDE16186.1 hypothetical protein KMZ14_00995 [Acinetobacter schindleri]